MRAFGLLMLVTIPAVAAAQSRWKELGKTASGSTILVDQRSVKKTPDGIIHATVRIRYAAAVKMSFGEVKSTKSLGMYDCANRKSASSETTFYADFGGESPMQKTVNKIPGYSVALKGSPADVVLTSLCGKA